MAQLLTSETFTGTVTGTHRLVIPTAIAKKFLGADHRRVQIKASYATNEIYFHGAIHYYDKTYMLSFGKRYQAELGVEPGDYFVIQLIEDTTKYGVEMPEEMSTVLETDMEAAHCFEQLTDGKKRSLIYHILRIKNVQRRVEKALLISENLKFGIKDVSLLTKNNS
ncbi:MAG: hypothetical protein MK211_01395 [Flavobacteriales bacterium]|jgi:hypothetical protein|nr:hypothetical protein [Flavobacteriales bacterium]